MPRSVSSPMLVGRAGPVAALHEVLEAGGLAIVAGEAGVGKTRLLAEVLARPPRPALLGACVPLGAEALPYAPVAQAIRALVRDLDPAAHQRVLGPALADLARLVPELTEEDEGGPSANPVRLFAQVHAVLRRAGDAALVVEDAHWADQSTLDLLAYLARCGATLVVTYRVDEVDRRHPLRSFLVEIDRDRRTRRIELGRLEASGVAELAAAVLGRPPPAALIEELVVRSGGNPFLAEELLAARADGLGLPPDLRDLLLARVDALPESTRRLVRVAAVVGTDVAPDLLAAVAGLDPTEALEHLRPAVDQHVLVAAGDILRFRHALTREAVCDDLLPGEAPALHRAIAAALESGPRSDRIGEQAHHWYRGGDATRALAASVQAARAAAAGFALVEARQHLERAVELWDRVEGAEAIAGVTQVAILHEAGGCATTTGATRRAIDLFERALTLTDAGADPETASLLLSSLAQARWAGGDPVAALPDAERARALVLDRPPTLAAARATARVAQLQILAGDTSTALTTARDGVALARAVGDRASEASARNSLGTSLVDQGAMDEGRAELEASLALALEIQSEDDIARAYVNLSDVLLLTGDTAAAATFALEGVASAGRHGASRSYGAFVAGNAAEALGLLGRWDEFDAVIASTAVVEVSAASRLNLDTGVARGLLHRGDVGGALTRLDAAFSGTLSTLPQFQVPIAGMRAVALAWLGRFDEARHAVDQAMASAALTSGRHRLEAAVASLEVEATAGPAADPLRTEGAYLIATRADPPDHGLTRARRAEAAALHARATGQVEPARWAEAARAWAALGHPFAEARGWLRATEDLLGGGDRDGAAAAIERAVAAARRGRAAAVEAAVLDLARRARLPVDGARTTGEAAPAAGPLGALTTREREVLALVAEGRTNRQVAEALFISEKTASVHVSNLMAKLGAANRSEAAAIARSASA